jgi:hypothetical protein
MMNTIADILGCDPLVAYRILEMMRASHKGFSDLEDAAFESLAWECFAEWRHSRIASGCDDPLWDLKVSAPTGGVL